MLLLIQGMLNKSEDYVYEMDFNDLLQSQNINTCTTLTYTEYNYCTMIFRIKYMSMPMHGKTSLMAFYPQ